MDIGGMIPARKLKKPPEFYGWAPLKMGGLPLNLRQKQKSEGQA